MDHWMTFDEAWEAFFSLAQRKSRPSEIDFALARSVCEELHQARFAIRSDEEIFYSEDHVVHVNPGFLSAKRPATGLEPDTTYGKFTHRYEFENFTVANPVSMENKVLCPEYNVRVNPDAECDFCGETHPAQA
jgi:hypothetical protein